jgi:hypothetical protein
LLAEQIGNPRRVLAADYSTKRIGIIDKDGKLEWEYPIQDINGNTTIVNCHAGPENPQMIEVTPEKKVIWTSKDFKNLGTRCR